ncbi:MAG: hypothetical protein AAGB19_01540 [Cyanobacteria bacterium P01_F01_bin.3]
MFGELIDAIRAGYDARSVMLGKDVYTTKQIHVPPPEPAASPIKVTTLTGLVDYLTCDVDKLLRDPEDGEILPCLHIRIVSPTKVFVENSLSGRHKQRDTLLIADCADVIGKGFPYGKFIRTDEAVINLQAHFKDEGDRTQLLAEVGTVLFESSLEVADDGVSQSTVNKSGISRKAEGVTKNPVTLTPYRTFADIDQPSSQFIYRLEKDDRGNAIQFALFESGDTQWRLAAIQEIKDTLTELLSGEPDEASSDDLKRIPILA